MDHEEQIARMRQLGDLLRRRRQVLRLTKEQAVERCADHTTTDLTVEWWKRLESGARQTVLPWELRCIAAGLSVQYSVLLAVTGYAEPEPVRAAGAR